MPLPTVYKDCAMLSNSLPCRLPPVSPALPPQSAILLPSVKKKQAVLPPVSLISSAARCCFRKSIERSPCKASLDLVARPRSTLFLRSLDAVLRDRARLLYGAAVGTVHEPPMQHAALHCKGKKSFALAGIAGMLFGRKMFRALYLTHCAG